MSAELAQSLQYLAEPVRRTFIEDVEIRYGTRRIYQSYEADYRRDADGGVVVTAIYRDGKCISMPDEFFDLFARVIEDDLK